nr:putative cytochrome P450 [Tanacetum cinerariifolium]
MLYGSECWLITKAIANRVEVAKLRMLRWTCGKTLLDMIPNGVYRAQLEVETIINKMREGRLRWFEHVRRRPQSSPVRRVEALVVDGLRRMGTGGELELGPLSLFRLGCFALVIILLCALWDFCSIALYKRDKIAKAYTDKFGSVFDNFESLRYREMSLGCLNVRIKRIEKIDVNVACNLSSRFYTSKCVQIDRPPLLDFHRLVQVVDFVHDASEGLRQMENKKSGVRRNMLLCLNQSFQIPLKFYGRCNTIFSRTNNATRWGMSKLMLIHLQKTMEQGHSLAIDEAAKCGVRNGKLHPYDPFL